MFRSNNKTHTSVFISQRNAVKETVFLADARHKLEVNQTLSMLFWNHVIQSMSQAKAGEGVVTTLGLGEEDGAETNWKAFIWDYQFFVISPLQNVSPCNVRLEQNYRLQ